MKKIVPYFILLILFYACSERIKYKELASEKAKEMIRGTARSMGIEVAGMD